MDFEGDVWRCLEYEGWKLEDAHRTEGNDGGGECECEGAMGYQNDVAMMIEDETRLWHESEELFDAAVGEDGKGRECGGMNMYA